MGTVVVVVVVAGGVGSHTSVLGFAMHLMALY